MRHPQQILGNKEADVESSYTGKCPFYSKLYFYAKMKDILNIRQNQ